MRDQNGGELVVLAAAAGLICLVLLGGGFVVWQWQRSALAQQVAQVARLEAEQQRALAGQMLAEKTLAEQKLAEQEIAGKVEPESDDEAADLEGTPKLTDADEIAAIKAVLDLQQAAWNDGDIDAFMETYWKSNELTFSSGGATTRSWQSTLERYKRKYSTREAMGNLQFRELDVQLLATNAAFVLGRWNLQGISGGNFTLVLRKLPGGWVIVHDHTSVDDGAVEATESEAQAESAR